MTTKLIHAYTETNYAPSHYPAYINVSAVDSAVRIIVRSRSNDGNSVGSIELTPEGCEALVNDLITHLYGEAQQATQQSCSVCGHQARQPDQPHLKGNS